MSSTGLCSCAGPGLKRDRMGNTISGLAPLIAQRVASRSRMSTMRLSTREPIAASEKRFGLEGGRAHLLRHAPPCA